MRNASRACDAVSPRTIRELVAEGRAFLERSGVSDARLEAELLVAHALGIDRLAVFLGLDRPLDAQQIERTQMLLVRRARGEPCAYLTGAKEFYGRTFEVGPGVLVPRPETERLAELAAARLRDRHGARVFDLGTGSGCIAITLALELPSAEIVASDVSARALAFAERNRGRHGARVELLLGDGFEPVEGRTFECIVCNPPYVDRNAADSLPREVREFEPAEALFAPRGDSDHWMRKIIIEGRSVLAPGGIALVELGFDQAPRVTRWLEERGERFRIHRDLAGIERVLEIGWP